MFGVTEYRINLLSKVLNGPETLTVIMPGPADGMSAKEFYNSGKKYKVLWLLHAGLGDNNDWIRYTNICRYIQGHDTMLVLPNGLQSDYADHPEFSDGYNFETFFFEELMPFIQRWFPASDRPEDNFLCGYSMGMSGTMMYALKHPELFGGFCTYGVKNYDYLEPYRDMTAEQFRKFTAENPHLIPAGYGPKEDGIRRKEVNMIAKYPTVGAFLDSGENTLPRYRELEKAGKLPKIFTPYSDNDPHPCYSILWFKDVKNGEVNMDNVHVEYIEGGPSAFGFCDAYLPKMMEYFGI